jgi:serine protease Do
MEKRKISILLFAVVLLLTTTACGFLTFTPPKISLPLELPVIVQRSTPAAAPEEQTLPAPPTPLPPAAVQPPAVSQPPAAPSASEGALLHAYQGAMVEVYQRVNPSVVNIRVVQRQNLSNNSGDFHNFPLPTPGAPGNELPEEFFSQGQGSGFVWDQQGHIVTNNHVIAGADKVEVTFADGDVILAEVVGTDVYTDLAVLKVERPAELLVPVQMADSAQVKVGQLAIAIGNPFGLNGTMTVGIVSGLSRDLPVEARGISSNYRIPDIIQTDAPINPGNSGGVLVDIEGRVMGVTAAIQSPVSANAGVGFVIPSAIVQKVVPSLIESGSYQHPWIGISGRPLTAELAEAMGLGVSQRGALVIEVLPESPALKAGLRGSAQSVRVEGLNLPSGGDVIVSIDGARVREMADIIAYLARSTVVGQMVTLGVVRDGQEIEVELTLAPRPGANQ